MIDWNRILWPLVRQLDLITDEEMAAVEAATAEFEQVQPQGE